MKDTPNRRGPTGASPDARNGQPLEVRTTVGQLLRRADGTSYAARLSAAKAAHPSSGPRTRPTRPPVTARRATADVLPVDEDGSLVTEYGLLAVVAATISGVVIQWASGGALVALFNALLRHARSLVGA